jgi:predicted nucleic acid-binding protein
MRVLVDTNVILDFFLARNPRYESAKRIFEAVTREEIEAFTTASSITDIYYIVVKRLGDSGARNVLRNLFNLVTVIEVDGEDCCAALDLPMTDYEDALVATCAEKVNVDYVVTNDEKFLSAGGLVIQVVSSAEMMGLM